jgi:hypothetical protein
MGVLRDPRFWGGVVVGVVAVKVVAPRVKR